MGLLTLEAQENKDRSWRAQEILKGITLYSTDPT